MNLRTFATIRRPGKRSLTVLAVPLLTVVMAFAAPAFIHASLPKQIQPTPHHFSPDPKLKRGSFLVATKGMGDPRFAETVIFMLDYGIRGAVGLIINRPQEADPSVPLPGVKGPLDTVYFGGPVETDRLWILIRSDTPPAGARHVLEDVYESSNMDLLQRLIDDKKMAEGFHVYAGYAGWAPMQLDKEILRGDWRVLSGDVEAIFTTTPAEVWLELIHSESLLSTPSNEAQPTPSPERP